MKGAVRDRSRADWGADISPDTRVSVLAEAWFVTLTNVAPTTRQAYRARLDAEVLPSLGGLRVRELTVGTVDRHLRATAAVHGVAVTKMTRSVLSGLCGLATRHDALVPWTLSVPALRSTPAHVTAAASPIRNPGGKHQADKIGHVTSHGHIIVGEQGAQLTCLCDGQRPWHLGARGPCTTRVAHRVSLACGPAQGARLSPARSHENARWLTPVGSPIVVHCHVAASRIKHRPCFRGSARRFKGPFQYPSRPSGRPADSGIRLGHLATLRKPLQR